MPSCHATTDTLYSCARTPTVQLSSAYLYIHYKPSFLSKCTRAPCDWVPNATPTPNWRRDNKASCRMLMYQMHHYLILLEANYGVNGSHGLQHPTLAPTFSQTYPRCNKRQRYRRNHTPEGYSSSVPPLMLPQTTQISSTVISSSPIHLPPLCRVHRPSGSAPSPHIVPPLVPQLPSI